MLLCLKDMFERNFPPETRRVRSYKCFCPTVLFSTVRAFNFYHPFLTLVLVLTLRKLSLSGSVIIFQSACVQQACKKKNILSSYINFNIN